MSIERSTLISAIMERINQTHVFSLVKPYEGELDQYSKKVQLKDDLFPAQVQLKTPFCLVISKNRVPQETGRNRTEIWRHQISLYVWVQRSYSFSSTSAPQAFALLKACGDALNKQKIVAGCSELHQLDEGEYLVTTDLFTVYDQKYYQDEIILT
jgi:hypothetical protein